MDKCNKCGSEDLAPTQHRPGQSDRQCFDCGTVQPQANLGMNYINAHRAAMGYELFESLTETEIKGHISKIEGHAPYGNDPWPEEAEPRSGAFHLLP